MLKLDLTPGRTARLLIGGAPEGHDARVLVELAARAGAAGLLHIALDDGRAACLTEALAFFAPELEVLPFPAWDCLPYDRVSPNAAIVSSRIETLTRLLEPGSRVVVTTVNAMIQKLPPRSALRHARLRATVGDRLDGERLQVYLVRNGYNRAQTVREPGEFAVRGGIIDLFPPGSGEPLRLDLFGDELDAVRAFDPLSQRTTEKRNGFDLKPMAELFLDEPSIQRFRSGYRELFGSITDQDPLYEAVSAGRRHAGMEHWLPLFHPVLESLSDYMPMAILSLDAQVEDARDARLAQIADFYDARKSLRAAERASGTPAYKPLPTDRHFLDRETWELILSCHAVAQLSPFAVPPGLIGRLDANGRRGHDFADARAHPDVNVFDAVHSHIVELAKGGRRVMVAGYSQGSRDRLLSVLADHGIEGLEPAETWTAARRCGKSTLAMIVLGIEHGFVSPDLAVITEQDILGERLARPPRKRKRAANFIAESSSLAAGDLVVHADYGIGRYDGLETVTAAGAPHDCLRILYDGNEKLFVPVENIDMLTRFGSDEGKAQLDKLGGAGWQGRKARVKKRLRDMAEALLRIAAERELRKGEPLAAPDGLYAEFAARFPYPETEDQQNVIADVIEDLSSGRPMDRLVCGDVGFGKTEVALRATFVAALSGQQVAIVVPTTLLARQHHRTFTERFKGLPVVVEQLSRLVTTKDTARTKKGLADGTVDVVVGTHALLAKSISFLRLGLVVVDEEQHFGVKQKERLKELRANVHVLTLTATPIPRTLQMALAGVRELSVIAT
ncbi:MAG: DEAD/DEAH box helicase, partial [Rhodospirillaceae bacterium]